MGARANRDHSSPSTLPLNAFTSPRTFFAFNRRFFDPRVGRVGIRRLGFSQALRINSARRSRAISRLRACERVSSTWITTAPSFVHRRPAPRRRRRFTASGRLGDRSASNRSSTAVDTLLTFCPPGPEARMNCSVSSQSSMVIWSLTFIGSQRRRLYKLYRGLRGGVQFCTKLRGSLYKTYKIQRAVSVNETAL